MLHIAVKRLDRKFVELLIANGADVNIKDNNGETPLDLALNNNQIVIIQILQQQGAVSGKDF
jgi:ankyrin repeat protein